MSERTLSEDIIFEPADQVITLISGNELYFANWLAQEFFPSTPLQAYLGSMVKLYEFQEAYRKTYAPESSEMMVQLPPAKSALFRYGLEFYCQHPNVQTPHHNDLARAIMDIYPDSHHARIEKLSVSEANEAVFYGDDKTSDLDIRAKILRISRTVLAEIVVDGKADMSLDEARARSFHLAKRSSEETGVVSVDETSSPNHTLSFTAVINTPVEILEDDKHTVEIDRRELDQMMMDDRILVAQRDYIHAGQSQDVEDTPWMLSDQNTQPLDDTEIEGSSTIIGSLIGKSEPDAHVPLVRRRGRRRQA